MRYYSTNKRSAEVDFEAAVMQGLASDNGLFMPREIPRFSEALLGSLRRLSIQEIGFEIARVYAEGALGADKLKAIIDESLSFDAPLHSLSANLHALELFHGPTLAFKDFGAQFMGRVMSEFARRSGRELTIIVATSGDTGSAVAHAFYERPGIEVMLLYPSGRVSEIQEKQFTTLGGNILALEVRGSFDDCQRLAKQALSDPDVRAKRDLSSANSINIARLIPQIFYYFRAMSRLPEGRGPVIVSVPSGNFGNLTAGLIAKRMGLPIARFIAATNANDIVPHYLSTGDFSPRASCPTISNAMDVGNPSNFARIADLYGNSLAAVRDDITGCAFSDDQTRTAIRSVYERYNYILDPHAAVAYLGVEQVQSKMQGALRRCSMQAAALPEDKDAQVVFLATAHPAKFLEVVEPVIQSKVPIPDPILRCLEKEKRATILPNEFSALKALLTA